MSRPARGATEKNIVFIGMPGCGKTTVSEIAARILGRPWHDCDAELEAAEGMSIAMIFGQKGEEYFRRLETEHLERLSRLGGAVISAGGGAVLLNGELLRRNATVIYLQRDIPSIRASIAPEGGKRPLLAEPGALERLYAERHGLYSRLCDIAVRNSGEPEQAARRAAELAAPGACPRVFTACRGTVALETERLALRPFAESDFDAIHAYMGDEQIKKFMYHEPNTPEDTKKLIADSIIDERIFEFGITRKPTGILIGNIGLYIGGKEADGDDEAEMGWLINRENQCRGFATEAAKAVMEFAFGQLGLRRIIAHCDSENTASWRIMEKLGMIREAHYRKSRKSNRVLGHSWRDAFGYAILAEDYFGNAK
ncbi:MAG: GNAT family N-acetyltransferase [Clostridiales bacterium]|jgi:RimJ/RimL family protein N-acetyltransferase/shikimate kinase|nr:GNAT family N-acetyltransferase [Clostridiales bacterium]